MSDTTSKPAPPELTLILIHGATCNWRMWDAVRRSLHGRFQVIAPDLPGHGTRRDEPFTLDGAVITVVEAARAVMPSPVVLVGDSLGGYTAMAAATSLPREQLKGLVLGGCSTNVMGAASIPFLLKAVTFRILIALFGEARLIHRSKPVLVKQGMSERDVQSIIDAGMRLSVFAPVIHGLRGVDFRKKLSEIEQPVLIVNGSRDKPMLRQEASFLAVGKQITSHRFEDCEHGVSMLRSAEFAGLIKGFADLVATS